MSEVVLRISRYSDFVEAIADDNTVLIEYGKHQMARVSLNGRHVMTGNTWDFHPGCHGGWFYELARKWGTFMTPRGMASQIERAVLGEAAATGRNVCVRWEVNEDLVYP